MKAVIFFSLACLAGIAVGEKEEQLLRRIERILKPTSDDQRSQRYLYQRINKAEKECKEGKCKELRPTLTEGAPVENFTTSMKAYDECMDECRVKEQRSFDKLKEIEKKSDFWNNFNEVKKEMSVKDAIVYWTEIRDEFKLLEADQLQMEKIVRILKPSEADKHMRDELHKRINKAEKVCKEHKCKDIREKLMAGNSSDIFIDLMKSYDKCMDECRGKEQRSFDMLGEIDKKPDFWSNFKKVRHGMSREDALIYWTEIEDEFKLLKEEEEKFERIERILKPSETDKKVREELQDQINEAEKACKEGKCKTLHEKLAAQNSVSEFAELMHSYDECMEECRVKVKWAFDMLSELEKKSDFWNNMQEVRDGMSTLDAVVYWSEIRDEFKLLEAKEAEREAITESQPTQAEAQLKKELDAHVKNASTHCLVKECASIEATGNSTEQKLQITRRYIACLQQCKKDEEEFEQIVDAMELTPEERELKRRLEDEVRNVSLHCQKNECAELKRQIKDLGFKKLDFSKTNAYLKCLEDCKKKVKAQEAEIEKFRARQQYCINLQSMKEQMSLQHALVYWVEIKQDPVLSDIKL